MRRFLTPRNGSASAFSPVLEKKKRDKEEKPHRSVSSSFREVSLSRQGERGTLPPPPLIDGTAESDVGTGRMGLLESGRRRQRRRRRWVFDYPRNHAYQPWFIELLPNIASTTRRIASQRKILLSLPFLSSFVVKQGYFYLFILFVYSFIL